MLSADVLKKQEVMLRFHVTTLSALKITNVTQESLVLIQNVLTLVRLQMLVDKMPLVPQKIMLVYVLVNPEQQEILSLAVFKFNTVAPTTNVQLERNATMEFVTQFAQAQEIVLQIKCVFKMFVNLHARATQLVLISNSVKITFAFKSRNVQVTMIVKSTKIVQPIQKEGHNVYQFVREDICAEETQTVLQEITSLSANASKDSMLMGKFAGKLNAKRTTTAATINDAKTICVKLCV
jgi:hypothetical protein